MRKITESLEIFKIESNTVSLFEKVSLTKLREWNLLGLYLARSSMLVNDARPSITGSTPYGSACDKSVNQNKPSLSNVGSTLSVVDEIKKLFQPDKFRILSESTIQRGI